MKERFTEPQKKLIKTIVFGVAVAGVALGVKSTVDLVKPVYIVNGSASKI